MPNHRIAREAGIEFKDITIDSETNETRPFGYGTWLGGAGEHPEQLGEDLIDHLDGERREEEE